MNISSAKCTLAIDAGGTSIKVALVTDSIVSFAELPVDSSAEEKDIEDTFHEVMCCGIDLASRARLHIAAVGLCIPGPFDFIQGIFLMKHKYASMYGKSLRNIIASHLPDTPIRFMHDSHAFLLGEIQSSRYDYMQTICAVTIGTGLGFAFMQKGTLLTNEQGGPYISIFRRPYEKATAEEYLSKRGIMALYHELGGEGCQSVKEIDICANKGDAVCREVFARTGAHAARILAPIIREYSIEGVILGGQIAKADHLLVVPLRETLYLLGIDCFVTKGQTIDDAPLLGVSQSLWEKN